MFKVKERRWRRLEHDSVFDVRMSASFAKLFGNGEDEGRKICVRFTDFSIRSEAGYAKVSGCFIMIGAVIDNVAVA